MARQAYSERTPLHLAAVASSSPEVIGLLLHAGAVVNARDAFDDTPLEAALSTEASDPALIEVLLAAGTDPNMSGLTLLHSAVYEAEDTTVLKMLIEAGAELEGRTMRTPHSTGGRTPLPTAVGSAADPVAIAALLETGADMGARDGDGWEPLHMAYWHGARKEVAEMLLAAGADINARTSGDLTRNIWLRRTRSLRLRANRRMRRYRPLKVHSSSSVKNGL